jgi:hypothetical protein
MGLEKSNLGQPRDGELKVIARLREMIEGHVPLHQTLDAFYGKLNKLRQFAELERGSWGYGRRLGCDGQEREDSCVGTAMFT